MSVFEIRGAVQTRRVGRQADSHIATARRNPLVVQSRNRYLGIDTRGVDQTELALLVGVSPRVEYRHVPAHRLPLRNIVNAGQEAVFEGPDVREGFNVQIRLELQPPVAFSAPDIARQSLVGSAQLQFSGVEMRRLLCAQAQSDRPGLVAGIVDCVNGHRTIPFGTVDDSHESLPHNVGSRHEQREGMRVLCEGTRRLHQQERESQVWAERSTVPEPGFLVGPTPEQCPGEQLAIHIFHFKSPKSYLCCSSAASSPPTPRRPHCSLSPRG